MSDPRFPIGPFQPPAVVTPEMREEFLDRIESLPADLRNAVHGLADAQLDTPYREGGWTVRQLVHHVADSHMNALIRHKLALTEETPTIKPYDQARWADLPDARIGPVALSLAILDAVHARWSMMLRALAPEHFARRFHHPEIGKTISIDVNLALYAWHGAHHTAHVTALREQRGW